MQKVILRKTCKTMKNVWKSRNMKLVNSDKRKNYLVYKAIYYSI